MTTHTTADLGLGTIAPSGPAKFPASMAAGMIRNKLYGSTLKVAVLVASTNKALRGSMISHMDTMPGMARRQIRGSDATVFTGRVSGLHGNWPCLCILADKQDDPAFSAFRLSEGEPMQMIALHDGALATSSGYSALASSAAATPLQLEASL